MSKTALSMILLKYSRIYSTLSTNLLYYRGCLTVKNEIINKLVYRQTPGSNTVSSINSAFQLRCLSTKNEATTDSKQVDRNLKEMFLRCNEEVWNEKPEGFDLKLKYVDTHAEMDHRTKVNAKVILGLHGTPGSHKDLIPLLDPLAKMGYRVIIPVMPGLGYSVAIPSKHEVFFTHSSKEKFHILLSLLNILNVLHIDAAVGHCAGTSVLTLLLSTTDVCSSALYLCPIPAQAPPKAFQPYGYVMGLVRWYEKKLRIFKPILYALMVLQCKRNEIPISKRYVYHFFLSAIGIGYDYLPGMAMVLEKKHNIIYVFSRHDIFVERELNLEYADILGIKEEHISQFDECHSNHCDICDTRLHDIDKSDIYVGENNIPKDEKTKSSYDHKFKFVKKGIELNSNNHYPQREEQYHNFLVNEIKCLLSLKDEVR